uniref:Uncharacterized protein n=1 Tax=Rhizophora mucronata TaxID=61149 RepID=A0A2P2NMG2_RHIMU
MKKLWLDYEFSGRIVLDATIAYNSSCALKTAMLLMKEIQCKNSFGLGSFTI